MNIYMFTYLQYCLQIFLTYGVDFDKINAHFFIQKGS